MNNVQPIFDPETHYRIEVRGQVDAEWLQRFDGLALLKIDEDRLQEDTTVFNVHADQAGIVWLVHRMHGLGVTILLLQVVYDG
jgi:hypothetical protein